MAYFTIKKDEPFYALGIKGEQNKEKSGLDVFKKLNDAIQYVKKLMCNGTTPNLIDLVSMQLIGNTFHIKQVGWDKIAMGFVTLE